MIWTRLYDPERTPPHWTDLVRPGQYVVFVSAAQNRAPRDAEGQPFCDTASREVGPSTALCESLEEATRFAKDTVARHPQLVCEVYDHEGKSNPPIEVIYDPTVRDKYVGLVHARRQALYGAVLFSAGIGFAIVDLRHDFSWIWGYVLGIKCLLLGGIFLTRGFLEWREHRGERAGPKP